MLCVVSNIKPWEHSISNAPWLEESHFLNMMALMRWKFAIQLMLNENNVQLSIQSVKHRINTMGDSINLLFLMCQLKLIFKHVIISPRFKIFLVVDQFQSFSHAVLVTAFTKSIKRYQLYLNPKWPLIWHKLFLTSNVS